MLLNSFPQSFIPDPLFASIDFPAKIYPTSVDMFLPGLHSACFSYSQRVPPLPHFPPFFSLESSSIGPFRATPGFPSPTRGGQITPRSPMKPRCAVSYLPTVTRLPRFGSVPPFPYVNPTSTKPLHRRSPSCVPPSPSLIEKERHKIVPCFFSWVVGFPFPFERTLAPYPPYFLYKALRISFAFPKCVPPWS